MQRSTIGVGPALRRARQARGVSIAEASRDTRIRQELIEALEAEEFERLLGDVYVRGALRSYSSYLGLPADRMLSAYAGWAGEQAALPHIRPPSTEAVVGAPRRRDNHRLAVLAAITLVVLASAFGILSSRAPAPSPARPADTPSLAEAIGPGIEVAVSTSDQPIDVTVWIDSGAPRRFRLAPGESRAFEADVSLTIRLSKGATADLMVAGRDLGSPGRPNRPWKHTFSYQTDTATPSPAS